MKAVASRNIDFVDRNGTIFVTDPNAGLHILQYRG